MSRTADLTADRTDAEARTRIAHFRFLDYHLVALIFIAPLGVGVLGVIALSIWELLQGRVEALAGLAWVVLTIVLTLRQLLYGRASVGADGLAIDRGKNLPRFVPWSIVEEVTVVHNDLGAVYPPKMHAQPKHLDAVCLKLTDGRVVRVSRVGDTAGLHAAIETALKAYRERENVAVPESLTQDNRDREGYREAAVPMPLLVRVAEDPAIDAEVRVRAARRAAAAGGKAAVRQVVEVMADREMRKRLKEAIR